MTRTLIACLLPCIQAVCLAQNPSDFPAPPPQPEPSSPEPSVRPAARQSAPPPPADLKRPAPVAPSPTSTPKPPAPASASAAPQGITAMEALRRITQRFGANAAPLLIEMRGPDGQTQPNSWKVIVVDRSNPYLARTFAVYPRAVADEGASRAFYPDRIPTGFITTSNLTVGSYDAFIALDKVASDARIGFDSIQYRLHAREGSNEPVWRMTALDSDGFAVGIVDVSGKTGKILRTVWLRRAGARSLPTVEDSALQKALRR